MRAKPPWVQRLPGGTVARRGPPLAPRRRPRYGSSGRAERCCGPRYATVSISTGPSRPRRCRRRRRRCAISATSGRGGTTCSPRRCCSIRTPSTSPPCRSLKFGYPQLNLRLYVLDDEGVPSVLFRRMLMPAWVAPGVRLITHQPAARARLASRAPRGSGGGPWLWRAERKGRLEVRAWQDSPAGRRGAAPGLVGGVGALLPGAPARLCPGLGRAAPDRGRATRRSPSGRCGPRCTGDGLLPRLLDLAPGTPTGRGCTRPGSARRSRSSSSWGWSCGCRWRPAMPQPAAGRVVSFFGPGPLAARRTRGRPGAAAGLVLASRRMNPTPPSERRPQRIAVLPGRRHRART